MGEFRAITVRDEDNRWRICRYESRMSGLAIHRRGEVTSMRRSPKGPSFSRLDPGEAMDRVRVGEAVIVDVREDEERGAGRIPVSEHVPLGEIRGRIGELPGEKELILVCRSGNRSSLAAAALSDAGYRAANLEGGVKAWAEKGLPFEGSVA